MLFKQLHFLFASPVQSVTMRFSLHVVKITLDFSGSNPSSHSYPLHHYSVKYDQIIHVFVIAEMKKQGIGAGVFTSLMPVFTMISVSFRQKRGQIPQNREKVR